MILYKNNKDRTCVWLFGNGLIGADIGRSLLLRAEMTAHEISYDWTNIEKRKDSRDFLSRECQNSNKVDIVWAAGTSGFQSSRTQMNLELAQLREILDYLGIAKRITINTRIHYVSSAGGLFEGQINVSPKSHPDPLRPYGYGKLLQEETLVKSAIQHGIESVIYRPSSVYGYRKHGRFGLITTLIKNNLTSSPTPISGNLNTLRDYVLSVDVGNFIANQIFFGTGRNVVYTLAAGQAYTISEIIDAVQSVMDKPLILNYCDERSNASHISFDKSILPIGWNPTHIQSGVAFIKECIISSTDYTETTT